MVIIYLWTLRKKISRLASISGLQSLIITSDKKCYRSKLLIIMCYIYKSYQEYCCIIRFVLEIRILVKVWKMVILLIYRRMRRKFKEWYNLDGQNIIIFRLWRLYHCWNKSLILIKKILIDIQNKFSKIMIKIVIPTKKYLVLNIYIKN